VAKSTLTFALLLCALGSGFDGASYAAEADSWDVTKARGRTRKIDFSTDEGTQMSVDVSPIDYWDRSE
jgi:hypothetical protein